MLREIEIIQVTPEHELDPIEGLYAEPIAEEPEKVPESPEQDLEEPVIFDK